MKSTETKQQKPLTKKAMNKANYGNQLTEALQNVLSVNDIANCLSEMLDAVVVTKGGNTRPDYRTRERALTLLLNYTVGTPVQRQEQVHYNMDMTDLNEEELITKLAESPAMLNKVQAMLDKAQAESE